MLMCHKNKRCGENHATPNKSLDARAKQRLCYGVALFSLTCVQAVSHNVNSIVRWLRDHFAEVSNAENCFFDNGVRISAIGYSP
jgi:hypothetical protein